MSAEILNFVSGKLSMYVASEGNYIPAGTTVDIYTVVENRDIYVKVCVLSEDYHFVRLPYYGTDIDMLIK